MAISIILRACCLSPNFAVGWARPYQMSTSLNYAPKYTPFPQPRKEKREQETEEILHQIVSIPTTGRSISRSKLSWSGADIQDYGGVGLISNIRGSIATSAVRGAVHEASRQDEVLLKPVTDKPEA